MLGLSPKATEAEVRSRFKALALRLHPDRTDNKRSHARFTRVSEAYQQCLRYVRDPNWSGVLPAVYRERPKKADRPPDIRPPSTYQPPQVRPTNDPYASQYQQPPPEDRRQQQEQTPLDPILSQFHFDDFSKS